MCVWKGGVFVFVCVEKEKKGGGGIIVLKKRQILINNNVLKTEGENHRIKVLLFSIHNKQQLKRADSNDKFIDIQTSEH